MNGKGVFRHRRTAAAEHRGNCASRPLARAADDEFDLRCIKVGGDAEKIDAGDQRRQPDDAPEQMFSEPKNLAIAPVPSGRTPPMALASRAIAWARRTKSTMVGSKLW